MKIRKIDIRNTAVIGDIHNCAHLVNELAVKLLADDIERFVFVGDLIDRGPDPVTTIRFLDELKRNYDVEVLVGNHDLKMMKALDGAPVRVFCERSLNLIRENGVEDLYESLFDDTVALFDPDRKVLISHAPAGRPVWLLNKVFEARKQENRFLFEDFSSFLKSPSHPVSRRVRDRFLYGLTNGKNDENGFPIRLPITEASSETLDDWTVIVGHIHSGKLHPEPSERVKCVDFCAGQAGGKLAAYIIRDDPMNGSLLVSEGTTFS